MVINNWAKLWTTKGWVDAIIQGFKKAFDTPFHTLLKRKLLSYGIGGKTWKWIGSFLCYRQQRVVVNGVSHLGSSFTRCTEGTVVGPLLFSRYRNDLSHILS